MGRITVGELKETLKDVPDDIFVYMDKDEMPVSQVNLIDELNGECEKYIHLR